MKSSHSNWRVLQIIKGLDIGSVHGGAERFAVDLSSELKKAGLDVAVCAFFQVGSKTEAKWIDLLAEMDIPCFHLAPWTDNNDFRNYWTGIRRFKAHLRNRSVNICHSHFQLGTISALYMKAARLTQRVVRTCHVTQEWDLGLYGWVRELLFSRLVYPQFVDAEVGVSHEIVNKIGAYPFKFIKKREPIYIQNAVPGKMRMANPDGPIKPIIKAQKVIGTVGRLTEVKGYRYLIEASAIICQTFPEVEVWIIGDGELRESLEELAASLGLAGCVKFFGQRDDAAALIAQMDLFVMTSLREGLPTVVLESFSQGVPVVGTDVSGIRELVRPGETGWLAAQADAEALANTIIQALRNEEEQTKFSKAGRELAAEFSIEKVSEQYYALYKSLLHRVEHRI